MLQPLCVKDKKRNKHKQGGNNSRDDFDEILNGENPQTGQGDAICVSKEVISRLAAQYTTCAGCSAAVKALLSRPLAEVRLVNAVMEEDPQGRVLRLREEYAQDPSRLTSLLETFPLDALMKKVQPSGSGGRCTVHKRAPTAQAEWDWEDAWDRLPHDLKARVATIEISVLEAAMHRATAIHRFCADCKHNVTTACDILTEKVELMDVENNDEFNPELYRPFEGRVREVDHKLTLECPPEDVEDLIAWYEDFDSKEYTSSGQRHAATLEHGQRELRAIIGSILLNQLRVMWHNHQAFVQAEQYFFCLVLQEVRTQLKPATTTENVVDDLVWLDDNKGQDQEASGQASQKNKSKNKKKKEKRKAKKAQNAQATADAESVGDAHENEGQENDDPEQAASSMHSPSVSSLDGNDTQPHAPALTREPSGGLTQSCFDDDAEKRLLASLYEQISEDEDFEEELDEELLQEMEALRQQQLSNAKEDRMALRNKLAERFEQLVASASPPEQHT